jgi:hypothetical protein
VRVFQHYPQDTTHVCPVCGTKDDKECVLIGIEGTQEGHNIQAHPFHIECIDLVWHHQQRTPQGRHIVAMGFHPKVLPHTEDDGGK